MKNQLEAQPYELATYQARLIPALQSYPEGATLAQLVVKTGLPLEWAEYTLRQMLQQYPAHLEINAQHELVYLFDFSPRSLTFTQMLARGGQAFLQGLWRLFVWVFKAWIVLMLCSYLLFNMLVLVLGISMLTRSSSFFEAAIKAMREVFRGLGRMWTGAQKSGDNLLQAVFSYVFGPQGPPAESQALEKRILAFIQQNEGKINVGQLIMLTGWSLRQAEEQAAQLMAQYQGDAEVSELGTITYLFPALENQPRDRDFSSEALMIWHHPQPLLRLNDNTKDTNEKISLINGFNLGMAFVTPLLLYWLFFDGEELSDTLLFFTMIFPLLFSLIFFLVPLLRLPWIKWQNYRLRTFNRGYALLQKIFAQLPHPVYPAQLAESPAENTRLEKLLLGLGAEVKTDAHHQVAYDLERLNLELGLLKKP